MVSLHFHETSWKILALLGGFGVIKENRVNILCRDIEDASEIDVDEAERRVADTHWCRKSRIT